MYFVHFLCLASLCLLLIRAQVDPPPDFSRPEDDPAPAEFPVDDIYDDRQAPEAEEKFLKLRNEKKEKRLGTAIHLGAIELPAADYPSLGRPTFVDPYSEIAKAFENEYRTPLKNKNIHKIDEILYQSVRTEESPTQIKDSSLERNNATLNVIFKNFSSPNLRPKQDERLIYDSQLRQNLKKVEDILHIGHQTLNNNLHTTRKIRHNKSLNKQVVPKEPDSSLFVDIKKKNVDIVHPHKKRVTNGNENINPGRSAVKQQTTEISRQRNPYYEPLENNGRSIGRQLVDPPSAENVKEVAGEDKGRGQAGDAQGEGGGGEGGAAAESYAAAAVETAAGGELPSKEDDYDDDDENAPPKDNYIFVALIDIMFTDGCKRACTGAIIHDNVVITAAHCFTMLRDSFIQPELSMSFVIIGSKAMFETGYEQYLPMERIVTHPRFRGWTADLALVFTFANMMSDKPGQIIPLASAKSSAPVDSNVTVLSWGRCRADDVGEKKSSKGKKRSSDKSKATKRPRRKKKKDDSNSRRGQANRLYRPVELPQTTRFQIRYIQRNRISTRANIIRRVRGRLRTRPKIFFHPSPTTVKSRYLGYGDIGTGQPPLSESISAQEYDDEELLKKYDIHSIFVKKNFKGVPPNIIKRLSALRARQETEVTTEEPTDDEEETETKNEAKKEIKVRTRRNIGSVFDYTHFKNWRRQNGIQQVNLTVGIFGYVNLATCKKIVERSLPPMYEIRNKDEVLCYSSEDFYITNEDSGAPVIHREELVAVTVGGVDTDGDHVAVGMKIACFCSWISENLPKNGGKKLICCKHCCNGKKPRQRKGSRDVDANLPSSKLLEKKHQLGVYKFVNDGSKDEDEDDDEEEDEDKENSPENRARTVEPNENPTMRQNDKDNNNNKQSNPDGETAKRSNNKESPENIYAETSDSDDDENRNRRRN